ncbi:MAG TPA: AarF/UbiB family protein [Pyrinomonadaceae bacterium]|jgi:predicted unusual protein kinase regulating ubiquinone biosynthesis (AarF/ABC1/UbiB family)|nr:AarF/UbiB family protein [Pyrinomonadaceae bacterium]
MALKEQKVVALLAAGDVGRDDDEAPGGIARADQNGRPQTALTLAPSPRVVEDAASAGDGAGEAVPPGDAAAQRPRMGWRGWLRALRVARVLGLLNLYLFLDNYEAQAKFGARMSERRLAEARAAGGAKLLRAGLRELLRRAFDRFWRALRYVVFRGEDASAGKEARLQKQAAWLKRSLLGLGPTFIKIGQTLATRGDLLPLPYVKELMTLQDQVPAFPTAEAFARVEAELGRTISEAFAEIDVEPIASASLGQVYRARLHTGEEVAVKVQRPRLAGTIQLDIHVLRSLLTLLLARFPRFAENADWLGMLDEFSETIHEEMDYVHEARNAERFRRNFRAWRVVHVPVIHSSHTTSRVLTMEFIRGEKVTDIEALRARRISPVKVNRLLVRTYLKQLLEDGFFHADPHPGNLLVMRDGRLAFFDFGMTGVITPRLQAQMIGAFFHVVEKDVGGLAQDLIDLNFLKPGVDTEKVRPVVEGLFSHYLNLKLGEVNFKELTYDLAEVVYEYPFRLPSHFTYIMRALMTLEGIGIATDPEFNFFETAKPYAKDFMLRREGRQFRRVVVDKLTGRDSGTRIEWGKMWKLAKMAVKMYTEK